MIPETGQRFGPYEILGRLGGGGMGLVFRAWDERLHREVAMKLLHDHFRMPGSRERFLQEARAASRLNHPNICTIFDIGEQDGDPYLVMELLEGETLKERIEHGALTPEEIVRYGTEIANALAIAHAKGIVHRDIKPANIFLVTMPDGRNQAKVLDFGLAKIGLETRGGWESQTLDMTLEGVTVGTLAYMSPEQARGESLDAQSDLFSLGVVMYEMATLQVPFKGLTSELFFVELFHYTPGPMKEWNDSIPRELERVVLKLLEKDRKDRFQTAKELREALARIAMRLHRGRRLNRGATAVPLVQALDPVARQRRSRPMSGDRRSESSGDLPVAMDRGSSADDMMIRLIRTSEEGATPSVVARATHLKGRVVRIAAAVMVALVVGGGMFLLLHRGLFQPVVLGPKDRLLLTVIQNRTGDKELDDTVMQGMEIALRQSASLNLLGGEAYRAGLRQIAADAEGVMKPVSGQRAAQRLGAKAYLYGEIRGTEAPYMISVAVAQTESNDEIASLEETAASRDAIPAAIGRLSREVRRQVGDGDVHKMIPLEQEATANVRALHAFAVGDAAMQSGRMDEALVAYREAAMLDPKFVQAQMKLAWLYREEMAEEASAKAAMRGRDAAAHGSERVKLLADFCYAMNVSGDYEDATATMRRFVTKYPLDVEGIDGLARVLRLEGHLPEALSEAQKGYEANPFDSESYREAELAMIGMDRDDGAVKLQAERMGVVRGDDVSADGLAGRNISLASRSFSTGVAGIERLSYAELNERGLYLDRSGRMREGLEVWRTTAAEAGGSPELESARASMLAQGAMDHALVESCDLALELVGEAKELQKGPVASFHAGLAAALCGDRTYADKVRLTMQQRFPRNTMVVRYYVPELEAAADIGVNEPSKALQVLTEAKAPEAMVLTPYLKGLAHAALNQMPLAITDFQSMLAHRGMASLVGGNVYPMAEIGVARAYAAVGNKGDSTIAYKRFLALWDGADIGHPRVKEALTKSR